MTIICFAVYIKFLQDAAQWQLVPIVGCCPSGRTCVVTDVERSGSDVKSLLQHDPPFSTGAADPGLGWGSAGGAVAAGAEILWWNGAWSMGSNRRAPCIPGGRKPGWMRTLQGSGRKFLSETCRPPEVHFARWYGKCSWRFPMERPQPMGRLPGKWRPAQGSRAYPLRRWEGPWDTIPFL